MVTHELWYKYERELAENTSEGTRAAVAHVYASHGAIPVTEGVKKGSLKCWAGPLNSGWDLKKYSSFFVSGSVRNGKPVATLQFTYLMGRPVVSKAMAMLPGVGFILSPPRALSTPVVLQTGANQVLRMPVAGSQRRDWEVEVEYVYQKPMKLRLYQRGVLLEEAFVNSCVQ